jgi:hypothetical protein
MPLPEQIRKRVQARLAEQRALVTSLLRLREQLEGSLFVRYGECGKEACACRQGQRHGPYYVLSSRSGGQGSFAYLEEDRARAARPLVARAREFRTGLKRLQKLNADLVALLRRYQQSQLRTTGRRLGIAAPPSRN